jgi:hypothetical protein
MEFRLPEPDAGGVRSLFSTGTCTPGTLLEPVRMDLVLWTGVRPTRYPALETVPAANGVERTS